MTTQTCIHCASWNLKASSLRAMGFGQCKAEPNEVTRAAKSLSPSNLCRIGRFSPAEAATVARREKELGVAL